MRPAFTKTSLGETLRGRLDGYANVVAELGPPAGLTRTFSATWGSRAGTREWDLEDARCLLGLVGHRWPAAGKALPVAAPAGSSVAMRVVMDEPVDEPDRLGARG